MMNVRTFTCCHHLRPYTATDLSGCSECGRVHVSASSPFVVDSGMTLDNNTLTFAMINDMLCTPLSINIHTNIFSDCIYGTVLRYHIEHLFHYLCRFSVSMYVIFLTKNINIVCDCDLSWKWVRSILANINDLCGKRRQIMMSNIMIIILWWHKRIRHDSNIQSLTNCFVNSINI